MKLPVVRLQQFSKTLAKLRTHVTRFAETGPLPIGIRQKKKVDDKIDGT